MNQEVAVTDSWEDIDETEVRVRVTSCEVSLNFHENLDHNKV